jgi:phospholipase A-2-activating protein
MRSFTGHSDAVRGLVVIPDIGFASCANDRSVIFVAAETRRLYSPSQLQRSPSMDIGG